MSFSSPRETFARRNHRPSDHQFRLELWRLGDAVRARATRGNTQLGPWGLAADGRRLVWRQHVFEPAWFTVELTDDRLVGGATVPPFPTCEIHGRRIS